MSKQLNYDAKMERLSPADRYFIRKYKRFEEKIRTLDRSMFDGTLEDHLQNINYKKISTTSEVRFCRLEIQCLKKLRHYIAHINHFISYHRLMKC